MAVNVTRVYRECETGDEVFAEDTTGVQRTVTVDNIFVVQITCKVDSGLQKIMQDGFRDVLRSEYDMLNSENLLFRRPILGIVSRKRIGPWHLSSRNVTLDTPLTQ